MKVITWNINGIRARQGRVLDLLREEQPDVLALQEIKVPDDKFPKEVYEEAGWHVYFHGQKAYNGVALISKTPLTNVSTSFPGDIHSDEARIIGATLPDGTRLYNVYIINGTETGHQRYHEKLAWLNIWHEHLKAEQKQGPVLVVGDYNICPRDDDCYDPKRWNGKTPCTQPEREHFQALEASDFKDLLLLQEPDSKHDFTWWNYRAACWQKNYGLRIDLALGTKEIQERLELVKTLIFYRKPDTHPTENPSDHAPVEVSYN